MIPPTQQLILQRLSEVCSLSEDVRFGQMIDFLSFLADRSLPEIEDEELLQVVERHLADLRKRQSAIELRA